MIEGVGDRNNKPYYDKYAKHDLKINKQFKGKSNAIKWACQFKKQFFLWKK